MRVRRSTAHHRSREALRSEIDQSLERAKRLRDKFNDQKARKAGIESEKVGNVACVCPAISTLCTACPLCVGGGLLFYSPSHRLHVHQVAEIAFIKRMEGSNVKHSLEKRLSDAAKRRHQHLETIRAKQQKMAKSPTSKDGTTPNSDKIEKVKRPSFSDDMTNSSASSPATRSGVLHCRHRFCLCLSATPVGTSRRCKQLLPLGALALLFCVCVCVCFAYDYDLFLLQSPFL